MEKVSIVVTTKEFATFREVLTESGFTFSVKEGVGTKTINIETDKLLKLKLSIQKAKILLRNKIK